MKASISVTDRNRIVENHLWCIDAVMKKNAKTIKAARLDPDDVYQQLALRLVEAVDSFSAGAGALKEYIFSQLNAELQNCRKSGRMYGIMEVPRRFRGNNIISLPSADGSYIDASAA